MGLWKGQIFNILWEEVAGIPGSLVSEPKHRDSRFESRLGTGLGIEIQAWEVSESVSEPKLW